MGIDKCEQCNQLRGMYSNKSKDYAALRELSDELYNAADCALFSDFGDCDQELEHALAKYEKFIKEQGE